MLELLFSEFRITAQSSAAWIICGAALWWGGGPERAMALVWLVLFKGLDSAYHAFSDAGYRTTDVDLFHAVNDGIAGLLWIAIALFANRNYPMWIGALQLLAVAAHLARFLAEPISPIAYAVMAFAPGYAQLAILALGVLRHVLRKRRFGTYRDWRIGQNPYIWHRLGTHLGPVGMDRINFWARARTRRGNEPR